MNVENEADLDSCNRCNQGQFGKRTVGVRITKTIIPVTIREKIS